MHQPIILTVIVSTPGTVPPAFCGDMFLFCLSLPLHHNHTLYVLAAYAISPHLLYFFIILNHVPLTNYISLRKYIKNGVRVLPRSVLQLMSKIVFVIRVSFPFLLELISHTIHQIRDVHRLGSLQNLFIEERQYSFKKLPRKCYSHMYILVRICSSFHSFLLICVYQNQLRSQGMRSISRNTSHRNHAWLVNLT